MKTAFFFLVIFCFACNTSHEPSDRQEDQNAGQDLFPIDTETPFFLHLEGVVGDYPIAMELMHFPDRYTSGAGYQGYYYYQKYGEPIALYGAEEEPGQISLAESDIEGNSTGNFRGAIDAQGIFKGRWLSADQKRVLPFELKPAADMTLLSFEMLQFSDSLLVETGAEEAPRVYVHQTWLFPRSTADAALVNFLRDEICKNMVGDSLANIVSDPGDAFHASKTGYFNEYRDEIKSLQQYQQENPDEESWIMNYEFSRDMEVYFLSPDLLTLGFSEYSFTGGAHGNYGTGICSYDLKKQKSIQLSDLFKSGYEEPLSRILANKARQTYGLDPTQPLSDLFFQDDIYPTENFGLTDKGIFFIYNPYEIAAYVFGQIELFVSFEDIKEWMK